MIYQIGQISNRDTQVLYFYRILRQACTNISALYRYDNPDVVVLDKSIYNAELGLYEFHISTDIHDTLIPYLEFNSADESTLKSIENFVEVEVTNELILRSSTDIGSGIELSIYWLPSLGYIHNLQLSIADKIAELKKLWQEGRDKIEDIIVTSEYAIDTAGVEPNLINIGKRGTELIYDDSHYMLSGSLATQTLLNISQDVVSTLLKSQTGNLSFVSTDKVSRVYQGFYGGSLTVSGLYSTLVLKDITSIVYLNSIEADRIIIDNCPAVIFRKNLKEAGKSELVKRLEIRNTYLTIYQNIRINSIWIYRRSTVVFESGVIDRIGFLEIGSTLVSVFSDVASPTITNINISALQGLFYSVKPPANKPYLDEVYLAHKGISFQRGQIDDQIPISQANVNIYIDKKPEPGPGPEPGPTPSGKIYSPFTNWYWSGDSRTVQLINQTHTDGKGYGGQALAKLIEVQGEIETEGVQHNIMLWWGVNGLYDGAAAYANVYKSIANTVGNNAMVFVGTVGHCPDGTGSGKVDGGAGQVIGPFNEAIEQFNSDLKIELSGVTNVHLIDIYSYIKELEDANGAAWLTNDNLHYKPQASQMIYDWVCDQITNVDPGTIPDAPTDTNAGRIWNWFKYANIPNVSNRPELIAGIIGNCVNESFSAIDLLGSGGGYYGPWCESQVSFINTVTNAGYTFHQYTASPGDDSAAIPTIFNWLTQQSDSWVNWLINVISQVTNQTGEAGARSFAELFCVCVERCINGTDAVLDPGVSQIMKDYYRGTIYQYQKLGDRRDSAAQIYRQFMGL